MIKRIVRRIIYPYAIYRSKKDNSTVYMTFDDGPHTENTPKIIEILKKENVIATFFVQGEKAEKCKELVSLLHQEGHNICNHSYGHHWYGEVGLRAYLKDVQKMMEIDIQLKNNNMMKIFRPPFGQMSLIPFLILVLYGYRYVLWTIDSRDSYIRDAKELVNYINKTELFGGEIILFHEDYAHTVDALQEIIRFVKRKGFKFGLISQIIK